MMTVDPTDLFHQSALEQAVGSTAEGLKIRRGDKQERNMPSNTPEEIIIQAIQGALASRPMVWIVI